LSRRAPNLSQNPPRTPVRGRASAGQAETSRLRGRLVMHDLGSLRVSEPRPNCDSRRHRRYCLPVRGGSTPSPPALAPAATNNKGGRSELAFRYFGGRLRYIRVEARPGSPACVPGCRDRGGALVRCQVASHRA
jgi:hypothetical protein